jgi:hypothetical protein
MTMVVILCYYLTRSWTGPRRDTRRGFAEAVESERMPDTLRCVRLDFFHDIHDAENADDYKSQPGVVEPTLCDRSSLSLHKNSHSPR